jgi:hypothetical protein
MARPKKADLDTPETEQAEGASASAFVFIGDKHGHGPDEIKAYGLTFKKNGKPVAVEDAAVAARLAGNSHFKAA